MKYGKNVMYNVTRIEELQINYFTVDISHDKIYLFPSYTSYDNKAMLVPSCSSFM